MDGIAKLCIRNFGCAVCFLVAPAAYFLQIVAETVITGIGRMLQPSKRVVPEDTIGECSALYSPFAGGQLPVVDEVIEFFQEWLEFSDESIEVDPAVEFGQVLVAQQLIERVDQQVIGSVQSRFCGSLLNHIDKILRHLIDATRSLSQFNKFIAYFSHNLLGEAMQVKFDVALTVVAQSHIEDAADIFACKRCIFL